MKAMRLDVKLGDFRDEIESARRSLNCELSITLEVHNKDLKHNAIT